MAVLSPHVLGPGDTHKPDMGTPAAHKIFHVNLGVFQLEILNYYTWKTFLWEHIMLEGTVTGLSVESLELNHKLI